MVNRLLKPAATSVRTPAGIILISSVLVAHSTTAIAALQGWAVVYYVAALTSLYADVLAQGALAVRTLLGRAQLGYLNRAIIRELSLVILVLRLQTLTPDAFFVFALAVLALPATRFALPVPARAAGPAPAPAGRGPGHRPPAGRAGRRTGLDAAAAADPGADERRGDRAVGARHRPRGVGPVLRRRRRGAAVHGRRLRRARAHPAGQAGGPAGRQYVQAVR